MLEHRGSILAEPPDAPQTIIDCEQCGFAHVAPLPTPEDVDAYYKADRLSDEHAPSDWFDVEEAQWGYNKHVYSQWIADIHKDTHNAEYRLLDIGCGSGWFLHTVKEFTHWQGVGLEPAPKPRHLAEEKGLTVFDSVISLSNAAIEGLDERYNAISMILLLEHLAEPLTILHAAHDWLSGDGKILISVPNDFTTIQQIARQKYNLPAWWVCAPHVSYFSIDSIQALMKRAGFEVVDVWTTYPIDMMLLQGWPYVGDEDLGRWCYKRKMEFEMAYYEAGKANELRRLQRAWCEAGIGREVIVIGRKT